MRAKGLPNGIKVVATHTQRHQNFTGYTVVSHSYHDSLWWSGFICPPFTANVWAEV